MRVVEVCFDHQGSIWSVFDLGAQAWITDAHSFKLEWSPFNGNLMGWLSRAGRGEEYVIVRSVSWMIEQEKLYKG